LEEEPLGQAAAAPSRAAAAVVTRGFLPAAKKKSVVEESMVVKHTKQMALPNLLMMTSTKPLVPLILQVWLLSFLLLILFLPSLNQKLKHPSSLIGSLSNALLRLIQSVVHWRMHKIEH